MFRAVICEPQPSITAIVLSPELSTNCKQLFISFLNDGLDLPDGCHLGSLVFTPWIINELSFCLLEMLEAAAFSPGPTMGRWSKKLGFLCLETGRDQPHGPAS